jgi:hypothetical protein
MRLLSIIALASVAAAGSIPIAPQRGPGDYQLGISNKMGHPIVVDYARTDSLTATHNLGEIDQQSRRVFTIPRSAGPSVLLSAEGIDGTPMGNRTVTLKADSIVEASF